MALQQLLSLSMLLVIVNFFHGVAVTRLSGPVKLVRYLEEQGITSCDDSVTDLRCAHGGICVQLSQGYMSYRCLCPLGFSGITCSQRLTAQLPKFSGLSHLQVKIPAETVKHQFTFQLEILPEAHTGILLYADSDTMIDSMSLILDNSTVTYRFDLGSGPMILTSTTQVQLGCMTSIMFGKMANNGYLSVNGEDPISAQSQGSYKELDVAGDVYLGGHKSLESLKALGIPLNGFVGCIQSLKLNGRPVDLYQSQYKPSNIISGLDIGSCAPGVCTPNSCEKGICRPISLLEHKCDCLLGALGPTCTRDFYINEDYYIPQFKGDSYLQFGVARVPVDINTNIKLVIKPSSSNGLIAYLGSQFKKDFLSVALVDGYITVCVNLGSLTTTLRLMRRITLEKWYTVSVSRHLQSIAAEVLGLSSESSHLSGTYKHLNIDGLVYFGGHRDYDAIDSTANITNYFRGCISHMSVNGVEYLAREAIDGINIEACNHPCVTLNEPCGKHGICVPDEGDYYCSCNLGYTGWQCDQEIQSLTIPSFKGSSYLHYNNSFIMNSLNDHRWDVRIKVALDCTACMILWVGNSNSNHRGDFLMMAVDFAGYLEVSYDLGGGVVQQKYNYTNINDNQEHLIRLHRGNSFAILKVDDYGMIEFPSKDKVYKVLNTNTGLYLGSTPPGLGSAYYRPLIGCLFHFEINQQKIDMITSSNRAQNMEQCTKRRTRL